MPEDSGSTTAGARAGASRCSTPRAAAASTTRAARSSSGSFPTCGARPSRSWSTRSSRLRTGGRRSRTGPPATCRSTAASCASWARWQCPSCRPRRTRRPACCFACSPGQAGPSRRSRRRSSPRSVRVPTSRRGSSSGSGSYCACHEPAGWQGRGPDGAVGGRRTHAGIEVLRPHDRVAHVATAVPLIVLDTLDDGRLALAGPDPQRAITTGVAMGRTSIVRAALCLCAVGALVAGCMALPKRHAAVFQEPPLTSRGTVPLRAGLMTLVDARPATERQELTDWGDVAERATLQMFMDFSDARLFTTLTHVNEPQGADIVLRGEIRAFQWAPKYRWVPYVPGLAFLAALGVPVASSTGHVQIALEVVDPAKAVTIASYDKAARSSQTYWVYRYQDSRAGSDLESNSAFRQVADELQTAILDDRERIVAAVKPR